MLHIPFKPALGKHKLITQDSVTPTTLRTAPGDVIKKIPSGGFRVLQNKLQWKFEIQNTWIKILLVKQF